MSVELGSGRLIPGFEDQLVGAKAQRAADVKRHLPRRLSASTISRAATRRSTSPSTRCRPPRAMKADDDFAKSMGLEGIDQLREPAEGPGRAGAERPHPHPYEAASCSTSSPRRTISRCRRSMVEAEFDQIWQQLEHEASHEDDPEAARAEMEKRARRLSRDRRAPRAPRPAAFRDRPDATASRSASRR